MDIQCLCPDSRCPEHGRIYPCDDCGKLRTKDEGGTVFTVCDKCWDKSCPGREKGD